MKDHRGLAYAAFAVVCVVWGTTYLAIRVAVRTIPPMLLTGSRYVIAGAILFAIARLLGESLPAGKRIFRELFIVGLLMVGLGNLFLIWAEQWVPSGMAALLVGVAPFWAALMERLRKDGERIDARRGFGMAIGFIGVALLVTPGGAGAAFDAHFIAGAIAIQIGAIGWQYGTSRSKYNLRDVPPLMSAALQMLTGGVVVTILALAFGDLRRLSVTAAGIGAFAYLIVFGSVLGYTSYIYALRNMRVTNMSLYAYINPLVAVILGWLILNERLTLVSITAMVIILGGVALVQAPRRRMPSEAGYARIAGFGRRRSDPGGDVLPKAAGADAGRR